MASRQWKPPFILILIALLFVLLPLLACFQYEWLGEVSASERDALQRSMQRTAEDFRTEFDREVSTIYHAFELPPNENAKASTPVTNDYVRKTYADIYQRWTETAAHPQMVRALILVLRNSDGTREPEQFNDGSRQFEKIDWQSGLERFQESTDSVSLKFLASGIGLHQLVAFPGGPFDPKIPALFLTLLDASNNVSEVQARKAVGQVVVGLNLEYFQKDFIPSLVRTQFPAGKSDVTLTVIDTSTPKVIFSSDGSTAANVRGDVRQSLFTLAAVEIAGTLQRRLSINENVRSTANQTFALRVTHDGSGPASLATFFGTESSPWQVVITHRAGSLDAAVAQLRRKNLAISFSILILLGVSIITILISVQRERRLAQQQMEFVSTVSHELRTPLAVICSAGENLADGVVADPEQTRKYGALVRNEGRRLAVMVEQVLDFAGIQSGKQSYVLKPVSVGAVVDAALAPFELQLQERGATVEKKISEGCVVRADREVLVRAIQNLIGNALKYSSDPCWLSIRTESKAGFVEIIVEDRGAGIPAAELPHIFEPFYRGHFALDAQIKGSGLGLALVRQVAEAHHGKVTVESNEGQGSRFAIVLPGAEAHV